MAKLQTNRLLPYGPDDAKIYWIGEAPGREENNIGIPFVGTAGQLKKRVWNKKGIIHSDQKIHNVFDQQPPYNNLGYFYENKGCTKLTWEGREHLERLRLWLERALKRRTLTGEGPNLLVALGKTPMFHLCGKKRPYKWRGSILPCTLVPGFKVYPTLHPSHVNRTMEETAVKLTGQKKAEAQNALPLFEIDMDRIKIQAEFPEIRRPQRKFDTNLSFKEIMDRLGWILQNLPKQLSVDIETKPNPVTGPVLWFIGFSPKPDWAFTVPFLTKNQFCWTIDEEMQLMRLISQIFLHPQILKIFQYGNYDQAILGRYYGLRVRRGTWGDTMYSHQATYPYLWKGLEVLTSIYTWEPYYKDEGKINLGSKTDESEANYNCKDCAVTREIYPITVENARELKTYEGYKRTMEVMPSHLAMSIRGVRIDQEGKRNLGKEFEELADKNEKIVKDYCGYEVNLNSYSQKAKLLYGYMGLELQFPYGGKKKGKVTTNKNALNKLKRIYHKTKKGKIVAAILDYQKFSKLASTYTSMKLDADGRLRTSYNIISTFRTNASSSHYGGSRKEDREGGNLQTIPKRTVEGKKVRKLFIPDEGKVLLTSDRVQAEAQVVAYLSNDIRRIEMYLEGWDVHWYNARLIFGIPENVPYQPKALWRDQITKEEHTLEQYRHIGKTIVHAGNYGMGPYKLQEILALEDFIFEFKECKAFIEIHRQNNPLLGEWQRGIREELRTTRTLISPIGRKRDFPGRFNHNLYNAGYAFKPQNTVGEITEITIQRIFDELEPKYQPLMNVHDEVIGQCKPEDVDWAVAEIKRLSSYPIEINGRVLDIPVDFKVGMNWRDTKDYGQAA